MSGRKKISLIDRFDEKYQVVTETGCWIWNGSSNRGGYGQFHMPSGPWLAHRVSWLLSKGWIPDGSHVLHKCDTPACVNPDHLFLGTDKDNVQDMLSKGRENRKPRVVAQQHGMARLTDQQALEIYQDPSLQREIAKRFGVWQGTVSHIKTGRQWSTVTGAIRKEKVSFPP